MTFTRLLGVVPVRSSRAVKSYGYASWRPAGGVRSALLNLDRWGVDEILLLDITRHGSLDDRLLDEVRRTRLSTPLTYGGGLRSMDDVSRVLKAGADRILVESLIWSDRDELTRISEVVGRQAIVAALPVIASAHGPLSVWAPTEQHGARPSELGSWIERLAATPCEEVLVIDVASEGRSGSFQRSISDALGTELARIGRPAIWFGGVDGRIASDLLDEPVTTGVAVGNPLFEGELVMMDLRDRLASGGRHLVRPVRNSRD